MDTQAPERQLYTFGTLPAGVVLLYREELGDPYTCQAPGCTHRPLRSKQAAIDHGKTHRAAWGLYREEGVHLHSGRRPWRKDPSYAPWRQEQQTLQQARRRGAAASREGQHRVIVASHQATPMGGKRSAPCAVGFDVLQPSKPGVRFRVVSVAEPGPGRKRLEIFGEPEGEQLEGACQAALSWLMTHQSAVRACFPGNVTDWSVRDLSFKLEMLEVGMGSYPKSGPSIGLAAACSFLQAFTGIGVEEFVMMTGRVTLAGQILGVSGLESKLATAHACKQVKVFVLPRSNHEEARQIQIEKGYDSAWLLPVESMAEVVYHLFKHSVYMFGLPLAPELGPDDGRLVCSHGLFLVSLEDDYYFSVVPLECALLPGSGTLSVTGQASVSNVEDAHKALRVVQRYCDAPSSELRLVRDLRRWDLHMNVLGDSCGRGMLGMAMVAAILALACGRTLEPRLIFAAGVSVVGEVQDAWVGPRLRAADIERLNGKCIMAHPSAIRSIRKLVESREGTGGGSGPIEVVGLPLQLRTPGDIVELAKLLWA